MRQTRISVYKDITKKSNKKIVTTIIKLIKMAQIFVRYKEIRDIIKKFYYFLLLFYFLLPGCDGYCKISSSPASCIVTPK